VAGPALVNLLLEKGYDVRIFSRHCASSNDFPEEVERFQGDLLDRRAVSKALKDVHGVFHLAAKLHDTKGLCHGDEYQRINVEGTDVLVSEARAAGVARFVFFSTINVYGCTGRNEWFDEASPVSPRDRYSRSKLEAEKLVLGAGQDGVDGFSAVVLRVAAVYGKRMKGNYKTLASYLKMGGFLLFGDGENKRTLVFDKDLAAAALLALEHPRAQGKIYNITDGHVHSFNGIVSSMCRSLGRKDSFLNVPEKLVGLIARLENKAPFPLGVSRFTRMAEKQMESIAVSGEKVQRELGFVPGYDLSKGWKELAGWVKER
jgi:UDP-glucose 4-epimerase